AEALLTRSETALSTSNFEDSQQSSKDAIKLCREAKKIYAELQEQLEKAQTLIVNNKIFIDTTNAEKFLEQTKTKMSTGNYSEAIKSVTKVFNNITTLKQKKNPELTVKCPDSLIFKRDTWEKCPLEISNEGKVHASNVNLKLSDEIETRGISTIAKLAAGELKPLEFGIKSTKLGELPIELELTYTNPITAENLKFQGAMWLKVEPKSGEEDLTPDKIQRGIYAERATLSLSKRGDEYEIGFRTARGSGEACQISEFIKISPDTRDDVITKINDIVTMLNIFCRADEPSAQSEEAKAQEPSNAGLDISEKLGLKDKIQELSSLGELIYGTFLPVTVQQNLETIQEPLILNTNDNEIPWELLHDKTEFICLKVPIGRRLRSREVARVNPVIESDKIKILFIVNASGDLDSTEEEVAYIRQELTSEVDVDTLQDREATNAAILTALHSGAYDIIHYAGHAEFNLTSPDESALHVANKGKIYAQEIKRALGGKPLVFLNACSSGLEKLREGGGGYSGSDTEGLASSFLLGGALALIGASWPMPDVSAGLLASKFYEYFLNGESVGESLRKARLDFRAKRPEDVNWMAFILYGDPTLRLTRNITT
ncbi:MAG: CHAT domain-containing protein, partial [Thermoplasmata archaeon]|nr:CHAT domain-containing protein [Thermoplasmata archaeon]